MAILKTHGKEEYITLKIIEYFKKRCSYNIYREVVFLNKRIDIIVQDKKTQELSAIEVKVHWWKKVIEQARINLLCADKVYIALPDKKMHLLCNYRNYLDKYGIGLFSIPVNSCSNEVREIIPPNKSVYKGFGYTNELQNAVRNGYYSECCNE